MVKLVSIRNSGDVGKEANSSRNWSWQAAAINANQYPSEDFGAFALC